MPHSHATPSGLPPRILLPIVCALAGGGIALLSLAGWALGLPHLASVFPGLPKMVPMTAVLTLVLVPALVREVRAPRDALLTVLPCACVMAAALLLLGWHGLHRTAAPFVFGGDAQKSVWSVSSPVTSAMFLASAVGLLCHVRPRRVRHGQVLALAVLMLALLTLAGYLVRDTYLYNLLPGKGTSVLTALVFGLLAVGTLALRPRSGIMVALSGRETGAWVARRLLLSALALPVLPGAAVGLALRSGAIDGGTAIALLVWGTIALFTGAVWYFALVLYRFDRARHVAEEQREAALAQLREADTHKDDFMALLAHELRNPLAPIRAAADLLRLQDRMDRAQLQRTSDIIGRQVDHIAHLVDDLLDLSRARRGLIALDRVPVDLLDVVRTAIEQVRPQIVRRRHSLDSALPPVAVHVSGDHKRLVQVVANLLGNAAKYTPEGGRIHLAVREHAQTVEVCVQDNGIGIDAALLPRVFDSFTQGTRKAGRAEGGLGLGLALVRRLAELHDGTVTASSAGPGQGSSFVLTLPRLPAPEPQRRAAPDRLLLRSSAAYSKGWNMERFLFVYHGAPGADSDTRHDIARWSAWFDGLGSRVIDRGSLTHSAVEIPRRLLGPKESASSLCGYSIVEATDFNEAVEIAGRCPIFDEEGSVELARLTIPLE